MGAGAAAEAGFAFFGAAVRVPLRRRNPQSSAHCWACLAPAVNACGLFVVQAMGSDLSHEEAEALFRQADADGSGDVDADELAAALTACHKEGDFHRCRRLLEGLLPAGPGRRLAAGWGTAGLRVHVRLPSRAPRMRSLPPATALPPPALSWRRLMRRCPVDGAELLPNDDVANLMYVTLAMDEGTGESLRVSETLADRPSSQLAAWKAQGRSRLLRLLRVPQGGYTTPEQVSRSWLLRCGVGQPASSSRLSACLAQARFRGLQLLMHNTCSATPPALLCRSMTEWATQPLAGAPKALWKGNKCAGWATPHSIAGWQAQVLRCRHAALAGSAADLLTCCTRTLRPSPPAGTARAGCARAPPPPTSSSSTAAPSGWWRRR